MRRFIIFILLICNVSFTLRAQVAKPLFAYCSDSLVSERDNNFVYNNIRVSNNTSDTLHSIAIIVYPTGWRLLSADTVRFAILPKDTYLLPLTICRKSNALATWQVFRVLLTSNESTVDTISFHVKTEAFSGFKIKSDGVFVKDDHKRTIVSTIKLKNFGNIRGRYYIKLENEQLRLNYRHAITLEPGRDSTFTVSQQVPTGVWKKYNSGDIKLTIIDSAFKIQDNTQIGHGIQTITSNKYSISNQYCENIKFIKQDSCVYEHESAYDLMTLNAEAGYISSNGKSAYFGAVSGLIPLGNNRRINFDYHSRQFGLNNAIVSDIYNVSYESDHWKFQLGQVTDSRYFRTFGTGLSISRYWGKDHYAKNSITAFGVKHSNGFFTSNDNGGLILRLSMGKFSWVNSGFVNADSGGKFLSYMYTSDLNITVSRGFEIMLNGGIGINQNMLVPNENQLTYGGFGSYRTKFQEKNWIVSSSATYYDDKFPGFNRGAKSTAQSVRYRSGKGYYELYFNYDVRNNNYFQDTIYNSDVLTYNIKRYGGRYGMNFKNASFLVGAGMIQQQGQDNYAYSPDYQYGESQFNIVVRHGLHAALTALGGYASINGQPGIVANSSINLSYKFLGLYGGYSHIPLVVKENGERRIASVTETISGGPSLSFHLAKHMALSTQYNISKTLYDDNLNSFINISFNYSNPQNGIQLSASGSTPLQKVDQSSINPLKYGFFNISLKKSLSLPVFFRRRYYSLVPRVFEDNNGNGLMDSTERPINNLPLLINDKYFITDRHGQIRYRNIDSGNYEINLTNAQVRGLIPGNGYIQAVSIHKNIHIDIPFKKGCIISGIIQIIQDTTNGYFAPSQLKVTAIDSANHKYSTITNSSGKYFLSLPAGKYVVSLNSEAFNQKYKPVEISVHVNVADLQSGTANFVIKEQKRTTKILKMEGEVQAKATKEAEQKVGFVPLTKEEIEAERKAQAKSNYREYVPLEKDSVAMKQLEKSTKILRQKGLILKNGTRVEKRVPEVRNGISAKDLNGSRIPELLPVLPKVSRDKVNFVSVGRNVDLPISFIR